MMRTERDSPLDAAKEIGLAATVGGVGGLLWYASAYASFGAASPPAFLASVAGLPILVVAGWVAAALRRKAARRGRRPWASRGAASGLLVLLPALYAGAALAGLAAVHVIGPPPG